MDHLSGAPGATLSLDWNDLRYVQAVCEAGSVRKAAGALKVSHQTVARHIKRLEATLGAALFVRGPSGYLPTPAAEALVETADSVDQLVSDTARRLMAAAVRPTGNVRIAVIDWLVAELAPDVTAMLEQYPEIRVELVGSTAIASLSRREADLALRMVRAPMGNLVGRRLVTSKTAIYASAAYLNRAGAALPLEQHRWLGLDEPWASLRPGAWLRAHVPPDRIVARATTPGGIVGLLRAGAAVGLLPCFAGDHDQELVRVRPDTIDELDVPIWMVTHPDLQRTTRVRAVMDFLGERILGYRDRFEGRAAL